MSNVHVHKMQFLELLMKSSLAVLSLSEVIGPKPEIKCRDGATSWMTKLGFKYKLA